MEEGLWSSPELEETAKEELQILQTHHPDRFAYLKSELESFISLLRDHHAPAPIPTTAALTQASSTSNSKSTRKRKIEGGLCGNQTSSWKKNKNNSHNKEAHIMDPKRKDRVDMVLERAQLCLQKIKDVKSSLF